MNACLHWWLGAVASLPTKVIAKINGMPSLRLRINSMAFNINLKTAGQTHSLAVHNGTRFSESFPLLLGLESPCMSTHSWFYEAHRHVPALKPGFLRKSVTTVMFHHK